MKEHCVFCGADIPAGALYCQKCAQIVENMTDDQRLALANMLSTETDRCTLCRAWEQAKEAITTALDCIKSTAAAVADWFMEG